MRPDYDIAIIGGGPAGSSAAVSLALSGWNVVLLEKKVFPRNVVCGEFLSHEVIAAVRSFGVYDEFLSLHPVSITKFRFVPENGIDASHDLEFEAFGIKRSLFDLLLINKAKSAGAEIIQPAEVISVNNIDSLFNVKYSTPEGIRSLTASKLVAAYGRQNILDRSMKRSFTSVQSGFNGIKYHIPVGTLKKWNDSEIAIFSSQGIYCGVNRVDQNDVTLCFLSDSHAIDLDTKNTLSVLLKRNKKFSSLFSTDPIPLLQQLPVYGTGNIFFGRRKAVEDGIYMIGDAAGVIAPLAGDGIGMAIESGMLLAKLFQRSKTLHLPEDSTARMYQEEWKNTFSRRLSVSHFLQRAVLQSGIGNVSGTVLRAFPSVTKNLLRLTRQ